MIHDLCTVIITSFQREKYILATTESVFQQTYRPIELVIIDDGSTDNTFELLKNWKDKIKDDEFKVVLVKQENTGAPKARNRALSICTGEYIQEVGSDDLLHPSKLEYSIKLLKENQDCQSAWAPVKMFYNPEEGNIFGNTKSKLEDIKVNFKKTSDNVFDPQYMPSAALHRREVFSKAGSWNEKLRRWQDLEYQVKIMNAVKKYIVIDQAMYYGRQHNDGRINDLYKEKAGIEAGILSLKYVEKELGEKAKRNEAVKKEMSDFYFSLLKLAIPLGMKDTSAFLLSKTFLWQKKSFSRAKLLLLRTIISLGGIAVVQQIFKVKYK